MPESGDPPTCLRLFVSSPGDVGQERLITDQVIQRLDAEFGDEVVLQPYLWEYEPFSISDGYQEQIPPPSTFDIFICILWSRLGSRLHSSYTLPPDHERVARSGTEYEFVDAKLSYDEKESPDMLVWVNKTKVGADDVDDPRFEEVKAQRKALNDFLEEWLLDDEEGTFKGAVNHYTTRDEFEEKLESALRRVIRRRLGERAEEIRSRPRWPGNPYRGLHAFEFRHAPIFFGRTAAVSEAVDRLAGLLPRVWREQEKADQFAEAFAERGVEADPGDIPAVTSRAFLLVWGASGSGKSSLARAGILPTLVQSGSVAGVGEWRCATMKPSAGGKNPLLALAAALIKAEETLDSLADSDLPKGLDVSLQPAALPELVTEKRSAASLSVALKAQPEGAGELVRGALATASAVLAEREKAHLQASIDRDRKEGRTADAEATEQRLADYSPKRVCLALVVDQMEELFTTGIPEDTLTIFFRVLDALAASGRVAVIGTLRSEFFSRCFGKLEYQQVLGPLIENGSEQKLAPPSPIELGHMIRKPAQAAGVTFEDTTEHGKLDERIRDDAIREPDSLPLLEFCLERLYEEGADDGVLEHREYGIDEETPGIGQLEGVLEKHAEGFFTENDDRLLPHQREALFPVILQLATEGERQDAGEERDAPPEVVRRTVRYEELIQAGQNSDQALVDAFVDARLFSTDRDADGQRTVTVTHEALLRKWDRVRAWLGLDENRRFLRVRARVAQKLQHWEDSGQKRGFLLQPGPELGDAEEQFREHAEAFSEKERAFVLESRAEAERAAKRKRRVQSSVIGVLILLFVLAAGSAVIAQRAAHRSNLAVQETAKKALGAARQAFDEQNDRGAGFARLAEALRYDRQLPESMRLPTLEEEVASRIQFSKSLLSIPVRHTLQHKWTVNHATFSPDGSQIVTASGDSTARIWDATTGHPIGSPLQHEAGVKHAAFSPDGSRIITASGDYTARIWDATTGQPIGSPLQHEVNYEAGFNHAVFSPDGSQIVTAGGDGNARIWEASTGQPIGPPFQHHTEVYHAAFSPDGSQIVTASGDGAARIWEASTGQPIGPPLQHDDSVNHAAFSPDGSQIVTASGDNTARIWEASTGQPIGSILQHEAGVKHAAFSPDGSQIVTASRDDTARIWEASTGLPIGLPLQHDDSVTHAAFSPDGSQIITTSGDYTARIWEASNGQPIGSPLQHEFDIRHAAFSPDGSQIVTASRDDTARIWEASTGQPIGSPLQHDDSVNQAAFSPNGSQIVTASWDNTARIWDATTGHPIGSPLQHDDSVDHAVFSPDGSQIVTASRDDTARIWDASTGQPIGSPLQHESGVWHAAFSPDGSQIVTASGDGAARIWEASTGQPIGSPLQHKATVDHATFSPDGSQIVTASQDSTARIWDASTSQPIGSPLQHEAHVYHAAFSPDGSQIITASWDNTARIWDALTGQPIGSPLQHDDSVNHAAFSPDGSQIITASWDNTARIWEASTGQPIGSPLQHESGVWHAAFSSDGSQIVTASKDGNARIWPRQNRRNSHWPPNPHTLEQLCGHRVNANGVIVRAHLSMREEFFGWLLTNSELTPFESLLLDRLTNKTIRRNANLDLRWLAEAPARRADLDPDLVRSIRNALPGHAIVPFAQVLIEDNETRARFLANLGEERIAKDPEVGKTLTALRLRAAAYEKLDDTEKVESIRQQIAASEEESMDGSAKP